VHVSVRPFVIALAALVGVAPAAVDASGCLVPPVPGRIVEPFVAPTCPYCAGRRGVVFVTGPRARVTAAAAGEVTFAGNVAGTRYVVIRHADGVRATYGELATLAPGLGAGDRVRAGATVGTAAGRLYLGLRAPDEEETPIDPTPLLGAWRWRARLVPTDGGPGRRPPPPVLVCRIVPGGR
jgi:murein DD-endopeptidase MepM/ murein hydrolase activator NlpD